MRIITKAKLQKLYREMDPGTCPNCGSVIYPMYNTERYCQCDLYHYRTAMIHKLHWLFKQLGAK